MENEFNEVFAKYGTLVNLDLKDPTSPYIKQLKSRLEAFYEHIDVWRHNYPHLPKPFIGWIDSDEVKAVAGKYNDNYYIGISVGTYLTLEATFNRLLSSNKIFHQIGSSNKERQTTKLFNPNITNYGTFVSATEPGTNLLPNDEMRGQAASVMTILAMRFLIMHEYAHIIHGHLDYIKYKRKNKILSMEEKNHFIESLEEMSGLSNQALEMDADSSAVHDGINYLLVLHKNYSSDQNFSFVYKDLLYAIEVWSLSIYTLFRLYAINNYDLEKVYYYSHPPASMRQFWALGLVEQLLNDSSFCSRRDLIFNKEFLHNLDEKLNRQVVIDVEKAFNEISESGYDEHGKIALEFAYDNAEYASAVRQRWCTMLPELQKFTYSALPDNNCK